MALRQESDDRGRIAALLTTALGPPRASDLPPSWLRPRQVPSFARALAALRRHNVACVADPVGSGKTYIALAAAHRWNRGAPTVCLVPAVLADQWAATAARLGIRVEPHTHESVSRGRLPRARSRLVIIDESHRFRVPGTRRYRVVAPWLVGASPLLLTATPVVNRPADLLHQLRLGARDDALEAFGVPSLTALLAAGSGHPSLARLVITEYGEDPGRPRRSARCIGVPDSPAAIGGVSGIGRLGLSTAPDVAALVRVSLLRALASSPAAFRAALVRYRRLLRHAADAASAGRPVTRRDLRRAVGADEAQLVLWALLDASDDAAAVDLDPRDLPVLDRMISDAPAPDPKGAALAAVLGDGRTSIVFVTHRATVPYLRDLLHDAVRGPIAWCTGSAAGIGRARAPRRAVLAAFDPAAHSGTEALPGRRATTSVLLATDVAAEGLDLQRAERIVHYDLPWTPMRLRQREGRALRLGSAHARVDVVRFRAPPVIERRLGMGRVLRRKEAWPSRLGLAAQTARGAPAGAGPDGLLVIGAAEYGDVVEHVVLWHPSDAETVDDPARLAAVVGSLPPGARLLECPAAARHAAVMESAERVLTCYLRAGQPRLRPPALRGVPAELVRRLSGFARSAARARDDARLALVERVCEFLARGHTAGEAVFITELAACDGNRFGALLAQLPPPAVASSRTPPREWRLTAVVVLPPG